MGRSSRVQALWALRIVVVVAGLLPWGLAAATVRAPALAQVFHTLCHQQAERTMMVFGAPMLVCSRCAGVFAGVALGVLLPLPSRWLAHGRALVIAAVVLTLFEIAAQDLGLHAAWHPSRLASGLAMGWAASAFMFAALAQTRQPASAPGGMRLPRQTLKPKGVVRHV